MRHEPYHPFGLSAASRPRLEMLGVWRHRYERDVAPELRRFLEHETFKVRYQAAIFLGRLDYAPVEEHLRALWKQCAEAGEEHNQVLYRRLRLHLVLTRLLSRDLKGQARLEAMAAGVRRNLDTLTPSSWTMATHVPCPEFTIQREVFELLYSMAKAGEDIEPLRSRLGFGGEYRLPLEGASLPLEVEITSILDHLEKKEFGGSGHFLSNDYLPNHGPRALELLLERLQHMLEHPKQHFRLMPPLPGHIEIAEKMERQAAERGEEQDYSHIKRPHYAYGYSSIFYAASLSDDSRFLPVLWRLEKKFQDDPDTEVSHDARTSQERLWKRLEILQSSAEDAAPPL